VLDGGIQRSIEETFGKFGLAEMKVRMIDFEEATGLALFRCDLGSLERLRAVLVLTTNIDGIRATAMVLRSSGTIKALKEYARRHRGSFLP